MKNAFCIDAWELYESLDDGRIDKLMQIIKENNKEEIFKEELKGYFIFTFSTPQDRNKALNEVSKSFKTATLMTRFHRRKRHES